MSIDTSYYTCIGIRIPWSEIEEQGHFKVQNCKHSNPDSCKFKFCPECGAEVKWNEQADYRYKSFVKDSIYDDLKIGNFVVYRDSHNYKPTEYAFLGSVISMDNYDSISSLDIPEIGKVRKELEDLLTPLGLWNPVEFRIWSWIHFS